MFTTFIIFLSKSTVFTCNTCSPPPFSSAQAHSHTHVHRPTHTHTRMCTGPLTHACAQAHSQTHTHVHRPTHTHMNTHTHACAHAHLHTQTHTHMCTQIHINTNICTQRVLYEVKVKFHWEEVGHSHLQTWLTSAS